MSKFAVRGVDFIKEGDPMKPNFWRAPTDNDFGANLQNRMAVWKQPMMKLKDFKWHKENGLVIVNATYDMPSVSAELAMTYTINNIGQVKVVQKMTASKEAKVVNLFRFGMRMMMPEDFNAITYYGRGPVENYVDRKHSANLGIYRQSVDEQFYAYIRPQETGNKTDIRWWNICNAAKQGLNIVAAVPFSASALHAKTVSCRFFNADAESFLMIRVASSNVPWPQDTAYEMLFSEIQLKRGISGFPDNISQYPALIKTSTLSLSSNTRSVVSSPNVISPVSFEKTALSVFIKVPALSKTTERDMDTYFLSALILIHADTVSKGLLCYMPNTIYQRVT
jgi:hypothetical protein